MNAGQSVGLIPHCGRNNLGKMCFLLFIYLFVYESNGNSFKTNSSENMSVHLLRSSALVGACAAVSSFLYPSSLLVDLL